MDDSSQPSSSSFNAASFVGHYFDLWNRGDVDGIAGKFATGGLYKDPSIGEITPAVLRAYITDLRKSFPDLRWVPTQAPEFVHDTRTIYCQWTMTGTQSGPMSGDPLGLPITLPPTGRTGTATGLDAIRLDDGGRILRHDT